MAHFVYALNGQGRGHTSRSLAVAEELRRRGHAVTFCCGGAAAQRLRRRGEAVLAVPAPHEVVRANRVRLLASAWRNGPLALRLPETAERLAERVSELQADLVVSDFEPFAPRAARLLGLPAVALDRQHVLTEARAPVPVRHAASAALTRLGVRLMAPRSLFARLLVPAFAPLPLRAGSRAELLPPILRSDVLGAAPSDTGRVLVYVNHPAGSEPLLRALGEAAADFAVYNVPRPPDPGRYPNLTFEPPSRDGFVRDLAACRAVVCTAGFTLLSEALWLGKPVLALPNRGFFEQTFNALALERSGRGQAAFGAVSARRLDSFLRRPPQGCPGGPVGNSLAADRIEAVLVHRRSRAAPTGNAAFRAGSAT